MTIIYVASAIAWLAMSFITGRWYHLLNICQECDEEKCIIPYISSFFLWPIILPIKLAKHLFRYRKCIKAARVKTGSPYRGSDHCSNCGAKLVDNLVELHLKKT